MGRFRMRTRRKRCDHCGELKDDVLDNRLCAECESDYFTYCEVCKEWISRDDGLHRHVFWTDCGFAGVGSNETDKKHFKEPVQKFLDRLTWPVVAAMRSGISSGEFYLHFMSSILGGYAHISAHGVPFEFYSFDRQFEQDDLTADESKGLQWLFTIYKFDSLEGNKMTLEWIDEWLDRRAHHEIIKHFRAA